MFLLHFIPRKGKGPWLIVMPLILIAILYIVADSISLDERYIVPIALLLSGFILFTLDNRRATTIEGDLVTRIVKLPREKGKNTLIWIELRYWAILMGLTGFIWFISVMFSHYHE